MNDIKLTLGGKPINLDDIDPKTFVGIDHGVGPDITATVTVTFDPERSDLTQFLADLQPLSAASCAAFFKQMLALGLFGKRARFARRAMGITPRLGPVRGRRSRQNRGNRARNRGRLGLPSASRTQPTSRRQYRKDVRGAPVQYYWYDDGGAIREVKAPPRAIRGEAGTDYVFDDAAFGREVER